MELNCSIIGDDDDHDGDRDEGGDDDEVDGDGESDTDDGEGNDDGESDHHVELPVSHRTTTPELAEPGSPACARERSC